jgi:hypothetical protein
MAQAQPPAGGISQELKERIIAQATDTFNDMKANATAEQKALYFERIQKNQTDPAFQSQNMANLNEDWNASDADQDGKLILAEFQVWLTKAKDRERAAGVYVRPDDPARAEAFYNLINAVSEGDGVVLMDFFKVMGPWMAKYLELNTDSALPQALLDQIDAYAADRYNVFKANGTPEQQTHYWEFMAKIKNPME